MSAALGVGLIFAAYSFGLWGYCLLRGYNVTLRDIFYWNFPGRGIDAAAPTGIPAGAGEQAA